MRKNLRFCVLAEGVGFEPTIPLRVFTLSRRALSTAQTSLHRPFYLFKRKELSTTDRDENAMAPAAIMGLKRFIAASGIAAIL